MKNKSRSLVQEVSMLLVIVLKRTIGGVYCCRDFPGSMDWMLTNHLQTCGDGAIKRRWVLM